MIEAALLCLSLNVYHEARGEPLEGQFAVAQVTLNRAGRDPEKICAVVGAAKQFSWTIRPPKVANDPAWQQSREIAKLSLRMSDFTGGADHYHALYVSPYWRTDMTLTGQYGNHLFYKTKVRVKK
jgi:spore germination cell wall hydrolase CwlJ-like protein